jgi:hypothetical protein
MYLCIIEVVAEGYCSSGSKLATVILFKKNLFSTFSVIQKQIEQKDIETAVYFI